MFRESGDNLMDMLTAYVRVHPEVDLEIIVPYRENMEIPPPSAAPIFCFCSGAAFDGGIY